MIEVVKRGRVCKLEDTYKVGNSKSNGDLINRETTGKRGKCIKYGNVTKKNREMYRKKGVSWKNERFFWGVGLKIGVSMGKGGGGLGGLGLKIGVFSGKMEGFSKNGVFMGFWSRNWEKVGKSREFDDFWKIGKNREK